MCHDTTTGHRNSAAVHMRHTRHMNMRNPPIPNQFNECDTLSPHHTRHMGLFLHPQHKDKPLCLLWVNLGVRSWHLVSSAPNRANQRQHPNMDINIKHWPPLTLSLGSLLMVFSGLRTRSTLRDLIVFMSRPLLFLQRKTHGMRMGKTMIYHSGFVHTVSQDAHSKVVHVLREDDFLFTPSHCCWSIPKGHHPQMKTNRKEEHTYQYLQRKRPNGWLHEARTLRLI